MWLKISLVLMSLSLRLSISFLKAGGINRRISFAPRTRNSLFHAKKSTLRATTVVEGHIESRGKLSHVRHQSFDLIEENFVNEYGVSVALYNHKKSGAQVLSVIAPDENKVFGITFRTPPNDSTGIPHILEHSVLCGSRNFPVKEPFAHLMKGSLNTFLNAFTYPDRTCYPVASMNLKDFYNLIHVYLDAVLYPRAIHDKQVLQQEGWHFELDDVSKPLQYKGVVYNEMKGVYSSPDALMQRKAMNALFPTNTYSVDSGGDPLNIPDLTFEQFKEFHAKYYHPSNARVYFYGDDDPLARLEVRGGWLVPLKCVRTIITHVGGREVSCVLRHYNRIYD